MIRSIADKRIVGKINEMSIKREELNRREINFSDLGGFINGANGIKWKSV